MKRLMVIGFVFLNAGLMAQPLIKSVELPDSIADAKIEWVDLDNNGFLDILLFMQTTDGSDYIGVVNGERILNADSTTSPPQVENIFPVVSNNAYVLTDYDRDNAIDIIVSGEKDGQGTTLLYRNIGSFQFEQRLTSLPRFTKARFADLDEDATPELLLSGADANGGYTKILKQASGDVWQPVHDSLKLQCSSIETFDADGDGDMDLFISGVFDTGDVVSGLLINKGNFYFRTEHTEPLVGQASSGDFDGDGRFDIILNARDSSGSWFTKKLHNNSGVYTWQNIPLNLKNVVPFIADFNYDGIADVNYQGIDGSGRLVSMMQYSTGGSVVLRPSVLGIDRFGDIDHDGNLDLAVIIKDTDGIKLELPHELPYAKNAAPGSPSNAVALPVFNRVFMYWDKPADDHTAKNSLTYDLFLDGASNYVAGEFDLMNERRLTVTHGNNGTKNFTLLKRVDPNGLKFSIQAIDNSFHAGTACLGGGGIGDGQGPQACTTVETEVISACTNEKVELKSPPGALWFSFKDGYLGIATEVSFASDSSEKSDTIFYYDPKREACSSLKAWAIKIEDDTMKVEENERYACEDTSIELTVEPGWESIIWTSLENGNRGSSNPLVYNVTEPDSIFLQMTNRSGCTIVRKTAIKPSRPVVSVNADNFKIINGGEVQLQASGAQRYSWAPPSGLNNSHISDPVASVVSSTKYVVTGFDSLNCSAQATVTITVESSAFIPNLFSPNDDGQNDELRIYGLNSAQEFSFSIYNRDGSLVYKSVEVSDAVQRGWDGTKSGSKQPPGVYFWKVKGQVSSGRLLLNGKESGSIVLIR